MQNERLVDLSRTLSPQTPVYPGDPAVAIGEALFAGPIGFRLKTLSTGMHVGTHADAPRHYYADGAGADRVPLAACVGRAVVLRIVPVDGIVRTVDLETAWERLPVKRPRLLVHTGYGATFGTPEYFTAHPGFEPSLAAFLKKRRIVLFGIDLPSVKYGRSDNAGAHADLLGAGIVIVETLTNLEALDDEFFFSAALIKIAGMDGSPVRAYAINGGATDSE